MVTSLTSSVNVIASEGTDSVYFFSNTAGDPLSLVYAYSACPFWLKQVCQKWERKQREWSFLKSLCTYI